MRNRPLLWFPLWAALPACSSTGSELGGQEGAEYEGDADTDSDTDADSDADTDTDTDTDTDSDTDTDADPKTWGGIEVLELGEEEAQVGDRRCVLQWSVAGSTTEACSTCDFAFNLSFTFDASSSQTPEACPEEAVDRLETYAYASDYEGLGESIVVFEEGLWTRLGEASYSPPLLTYQAGAADQPNGAGFDTHLLEGEATVE